METYFSLQMGGQQQTMNPTQIAHQTVLSNQHHHHQQHQVIHQQMKKKPKHKVKKKLDLANIMKLSGIGMLNVAYTYYTLHNRSIQCWTNYILTLILEFTGRDMKFRVINLYLEVDVNSIILNGMLFILLHFQILRQILELFYV